jgi:hypothetical protein
MKKFLLPGFIVLFILVVLSYFFVASRNLNYVELPTSFPSPTSTAAVVNSERNDAIKGNYQIRYFYNPEDKKTVIFKIVNFNTGATSEFMLPYLDNGRYRISPDSKYILRLLSKKIEIASLTDSKNTIFKEIISVPEMRNSVNIEDLDYAGIGDAMWNSKGTLYFTTIVGADGVSNPFGTYTDLYRANEDGTSPVLINDHTKPDQNYSFMHEFAYIDAVKDHIYFTGTTHSGHTAVMDMIDAKTGKRIRNFKDIGNALPKFSSDYSKAYYSSDKDQDGYDDVPHVNMMEYDMKSKTKRLLLHLPDVTNEDDLVQFEYPQFLIKSQNELLFRIRDKTSLAYYTLSTNTGSKPALLSDSLCDVEAVSENGEYLFQSCYSAADKARHYEFYSRSNKTITKFFSDYYGTSNDNHFELLDFE